MHAGGAFSANQIALLSVISKWARNWIPGRDIACFACLASNWCRRIDGAVRSRETLLTIDAIST